MRRKSPWCTLTTFTASFGPLPVLNTRSSDPSGSTRVIRLTGALLKSEKLPETIMEPFGISSTSRMVLLAPRPAAYATSIEPDGALDASLSTIVTTAPELPPSAAPPTTLSSVTRKSSLFSSAPSSTRLMMNCLLKSSGPNSSVPVAALKSVSSPVETAERSVVR